MKTQRIAAIDIGSNSLKLVVVEAAASDSFTIILQDRERVRLGQETLRTRILSDEAIQLSADTIGRFRSIAESREADHLIAVATASVRQAKNAADFVARVEETTGVHVEVLPSMEEARLIGIASAQYFGKEDSSLLNIDIGGGSTEVSLMELGKPKKLFSMKLGAVGLSEIYAISDPPSKKEIRKMREEIQFALSQPKRKIRGETWKISTGTSGTVLNTAALVNFLERNSLEVDPSIEFKKLVKVNKHLSRLSFAERAKIPVISESRAEVIVAGALILEGVMSAFGIKVLETCPYALREGVIIDYLTDVETESLPPVPDVDDLKLRDVFAVGRRFGYEETHALQVAKMAETIFDQISPIFQLERHKRTLLSAAALLHDVGYHISHEAHHKHSLYLIQHSEMTGFSESEKQIIANVARYHRKALPKATHLAYTSLSDANRRTVDELSAILRLADGLDRGYESRVDDIRVSVTGKTVKMELVSEEDLTAEIYAVRMKKEGFEQTYGCKLSVSKVTPKAVSNKKSVA
ncbi:MAG: Ppx/GppA family phosphatase [Acidobacteriota bacterium]|nr:Ppx/GppA family phosphatase [Acidobacteriota bacterium]MDH3530422.1 Ppx/GppA family phosphatase [Acidobacteriota bacterium]